MQLLSAISFKTDTQARKLLEDTRLPIIVLLVWLHCALTGWGETVPRFDLAILTNGQFFLRLKGGQNYRLDTSSDLAHWSFLITSNPPGGTLDLLETTTPGVNRRFYRAAESPDIVGQIRNLGKGTVRSWVRFGGSGDPIAVGVTLTDLALTNLPASDPDLVLALPQGGTATAFNHIGLNWNPRGHPPPGVYDLPHFDVHFYTISVQERNQITLSDGGTKMYRDPDPQYLPPDYALSPNSGDPKQGSHWWDQTAPELNGTPFTYTFIYGYYDGNLTFLEPMVTLAFLKTASTVTADIKQPAAFAKPGFYPTRFKMIYSSQFREYSISLEGLTLR